MSSAVTDSPRTPDPVATFHASLSAMCRSGIALPRAFAVLAADLERGALRNAVTALAADLEDGVPFAEAYARRGAAFPAPYAALVAAGMASGDLPGALAEIARHAERRARIARSLRSALAGPLVSAAVVVIVGALLLVLVGPRFRDLSALAIPSLFTGAPSGMGDDAPLLVAGFCVALLAAGVLLALATAWLRNPIDGRPGASALALRWPVLGRLRLYSGLSGILTTLASLVRRGVPLPEALDLAVEVTGAPHLRARLVTMAEAAHDGAGLEDAARRSGLLPPSELWLVRAAEERGAPEEALDDLAAHYADRLDRAVERTAAMLGPAAEVAVGAVVFVLAYTFVVPITKLAVDILGVF